MEDLRTIMRNRFYSLLNQQEAKPNSVLLTKQQYLGILNDLKRVKATNRKTNRRDYRLIQRYDILTIQGTERLVQPGSTIENAKVYVNAEELFDIIYSVHLEVGHGGRDKMARRIHKLYKNITQSQMLLFISLCDTCNKRKGDKKGIYEKLVISSNLRCTVDLIDYQSNSDGNYKFVLVYQDDLTKFIILKPLISNEVKEVAHNILDIFLLFGAPIILQSPKNRDFCDSLIKNLKTLWPELHIVFGELNETKENIEELNKEIQEMITKWMEDNQTNKWSEGVRFVQFSRNKTFRNLKSSPYQAMFGCSVKMGLSTFPIPTETRPNIHTEEDLKRLCETTPNASEEITDELAQLNSVNEETNEDDISKIKLETKSDDEKDYKISSVEESSVKKEMVCVVCSEDCTVAYTCRDCEMFVHAICGKFLEEAAESSFNIICNNCKTKRDEIKESKPPFKKMKITVDETPELSEQHKTGSNIMTIQSHSTFSTETTPANSAKISFGKCYCSSKCISNRCSCRKNNWPCNSKCHTYLDCNNK